MSHPLRSPKSCLRYSMLEITRLPYKTCKTLTSGCGWNDWTRYLGFESPPLAPQFISFQVIDSRICREQLRRRVLLHFAMTCESRRVLPKSHYFHGKLSRTGNRLGSGGNADVWGCTGDGGKLFAAKVFRVNHGDDYKIQVNPSLICVTLRLT